MNIFVVSRKTTLNVDRLCKLKLKDIFPVSTTVVVLLTLLTIVTSLTLFGRYRSNFANLVPSQLSVHKEKEYDDEYYYESGGITLSYGAQTMMESPVLTTVTVDYDFFRLHNTKQRQLLEQQEAQQTQQRSIVANNQASTLPPLPTGFTTLPFKSSEKKWLRVHGNKKYEIFLYSAWYDDRNLTIYKQPVIKIASICSSNQPLEKIICVYYYDSYSTHVVAGDVFLLDDSKSKYNQSLSAFVIACPVENRTVPKRVSVNINSRRPRNKFGVTVDIPEKKKMGKQQISICVMADWRYDDTFNLNDKGYEYNLLEWITVQKMLGVTKLVIYLNTSTHKHVMLKAFLYQIANRMVKFLEFRYYDSIEQIDQDKNKSTYFSALANDCLNSLVYKSDYISVLTFDDIIFPKQKEKLMQTINRIRNNTKISNEYDNFSFKTHYFLKNYFPRFSSTPYSTVLRHVRKIPNNKSAMKSATDLRSIVNTNSCLVVNFHKCLINGHSKSVINEYSANESTAYNHNYKTCYFDEWNCTRVLTSFVNDDTALVFEEKLIKVLRKNVFTYFRHNL